MPLKRVWFQIHWFIGITAGLVLGTVSSTGSLLAFEDEIVFALNPAAEVVAQSQPASSPALLLERVREQHPQGPVESLSVWSQPGRSARAVFAAVAAGQEKETQYVDPYSGALLGAPRGQAFFDGVERWHRWLLLPHDVGGLITGTSALCLLVLALTGLYLRWPRPALDWRRWLKINFAMRGRPFLRSLHVGLGTWALLTYLVFSLTGPYWAFDFYRGALERWAGTAAPKADAPAAAAAVAEADPAPLNLAPAWDAFIASAGAYGSATIRLPEKPAQAIQIQYLDIKPAHDRARNRIDLLADGTIKAQTRYDDKTWRARLLSSVRALHTGSYFGLPGRIAMLIGAIFLPVFMISGLMMYYQRRWKRRLQNLGGNRGAAPASGR